jgi:ribosomal protein L20
MPRARNNVAAKQRHKKLLKMTKGYRLGRGKLYRSYQCRLPVKWYFLFKIHKGSQG